MWTAKTIRAFRDKHNMTVEELAQALGVALATVSRWERGHHAPSKMAQKSLDIVARFAKSKDD